jgi:acetyl-CoA carboxylase carboxyltransferase component
MMRKTPHGREDGVIEPGVTGMAQAIAALQQQRETLRGEQTLAERLSPLFDPKTCHELGAWAGSDATGPAGLATAIGKIGGRAAGAILLGPIDPDREAAEVAKADRLAEMAHRQGFPLVWVLDGASGSVATSLMARASDGVGRVPQVAVVRGELAPPVSCLVGLADFVVTAGLGDSGGLAGLETGSLEAALQAARDYLTYWPENDSQVPPRRAPIDPPLRAGEDLLRLLPESPRQSYDMKAVLARLVDEGRYFEIKPKTGLSLITALTRLGGRPVGVVASQPKAFEGRITAEAAQKATEFIARCDHWGLPLLFLIDRIEPTDTLRSFDAAPGILFRTARAASVPKLVVQTRSSGAWPLLSGRGMGADLVLAWPTVGEPEAALEAARRSDVDDLIDPRETRRALLRVLDLVTGKR